MRRIKLSPEAVGAAYRGEHTYKREQVNYSTTALYRHKFHRAACWLARIFSGVS